MKKVFIVMLVLGFFCLVTNAFAEKADDLRVLMRDARGAITAMAAEDAVNFCDEALKLDPSFAEAYANRAEAKGMLKDLDGAMADAKKAIELTPDAKEINPAYYVRAILSLDYAAEAEKALEFINKAIELKGDEPLYYDIRAEIHEKMGNTELAEADRDKAASINQQ